MLKRQQVLLEDWMLEHIKYMAEKYDISFSELIRLTLCIEFIYTTHKLYPNYKSGFDLERIIKTQEEVIRGARAAEKSHQVMSQIYFEARKALEFRAAHNKKITK